MKQYIDKDTLIRKIDRLQESIKATAIDDRINKEQAEAYKVCVKLRSFVEDTSKVKEVDLQKEFYDFLDTLIGKDNGHLSEDELFCIAEYFYELGLKAQKGE